MARELKITENQDLPLLGEGAPGHAAAGGDGPGNGDEPSRQALRPAEALHRDGGVGGGEGGDEAEFAVGPAHGLMTFPAPAKVSTMVYILVTSPTASLLVRP